MQEKCNSLAKENSELTSTLKAAQGAKAQILERAQQDEKALRESEQSLVDLQALAQESTRALENEKRAHSLLRTEMAHAQDLLNLEKKRREESETRQKLAEDQLETQAVQAQKMGEEIDRLTQQLRHRNIESLDQSQRAERSSAQAQEFQGAALQLQQELDSAREEKAKMLDERLELRRAVTELEHAIQSSSDSRDARYKASRNPWMDERNPYDKSGSAATLTLAQRIFETTSQIKNIRHDYAEVVSTNQELDSKFVGLVKTTDVFRHRIQDVESLISSFVSELRDLNSETESMLQETNRLHSSSLSESSRNLLKISTFEQRLMQQDAQLKEATETIKILTRARDEAHASLERCERLRLSAEDTARTFEGKSRTLQSNLEKAEEGNRRAAAETDLLRRTIHELESQYKELQTQANLSAEKSADELRSAKKENLRLQADFSQIKNLHMASMSDAESKEAARLQAASERDEAERRLKEIRAQVTSLDVELRSAEKEKDTLILNLEQQTARAKQLEQKNATLEEHITEANLGHMNQERAAHALQRELNELRITHENLFTDHSVADKKIAGLQSDLIEMRRLVASNEAEIENLQTINESIYSQKTAASEEAALLSQQYRDTKQQEARLIAELAESRLECHSMSTSLSEQQKVVRVNAVI